ncbi:MAG: patatin-like phospholipase family protein, partial [Candidatus Latescibacteria bacterium]|nr:patatin-like phospholipase family protein [Candidatus Latescibacterota bacterium]
MIHQPTRIEPSTEYGLIGLAFSGGGIRSATFNLGVIQALARKGILKYVDYLSTVSGGGYIGSCISSLLNNSTYGTDGQDFPFYHEQGEPERETFRHLRNNSNYLAPGGLLDKLRIPAVVLRGVLVNLLVLIPYIVLAVALSEWCFELFGYDVTTDPGPISGLLMHPILFGAIGLFVLYILLFPPITKLLVPYLKWRWRDRYGKSFGVLLLVVVLAVTVILLPHSFYWFDKLDLGEVWLGIVALAQLLPALFAGKAAENVSKLIGRVALYAV